MADKKLLDIQIIAKDIKEHRRLEEEISATNKAVATYKVIINDENFTLWLVNGAIDSGISFIKDFVGNPIIFKNKSITLQRNGENRTFSKNSIMAGQLIMSDKITFSFQVNKHLNQVTLLSKADYNPFHQDGDATNLTIRFKQEEIYYTYQSLKDILEEIDLKNKQISQLEELKACYVDDEEEIQNCIRQQRKVEKDLEELYRKKQDFIIEHAKLRYKAILDSSQEKIKRSEFFNNSILLIDGGPGTGKTTTLIQRIKYLIDPVVIKENENIFSKTEINKILNRDNPTWIFFSPNELLYLYLKESMAREGLRATSETGKVWSQYRTSLIWRYDLSNKKTKKPFVLDRSNDNSSLFESSAKAINEIKLGFEKAIIDDLKLKINELFKNVSENNRKLTSDLKRYINNRSINNIKSFINLCAGISRNFETQIIDYKERYEARLDKLSTILKNNIKRDDSILHFMQQKFSSLYSLSIENEKDFQIEVDKILGYDSFENWLYMQSKLIIKTSSVYSLEDVEFKFNGFLQENMIDSLFSKVFVIENIQDFGKVQIEWEILSIFKDSLSSLLLESIAPAYLTYRNSKNGLINYEHVNKDLLLKIIQNEDNRIHPNEQSFLIGMINDILKNIFQINKNEYNKIKHKYKDAFEEISKMVIAVDEASDFHLIDLFGIFSIGDKFKNSITICGDIMQRIEEVGINNWDDLLALNSNLKKFQLGVSYRQSPTLLHLASIIYKEYTSITLNIIPYRERHENEPKAIFKVSSDEDVKINWIASKILEIYDFYGGEMPSVAIFLSDENQLDNFAIKLGIIDDLADVGIEVKACKNGEVLGSGSMVRVFSLKYIKGLEFEAVIFHNLDDLLLEGYSPDSLLRKVYVGLSRATFYIAVSLSDQWCTELNFLKDGFSNEDSWQIQKMIYV